MKLRTIKKLSLFKIIIIAVKYSKKITINFLSNIINILKPQYYLVLNQLI